MPTFLRSIFVIVTLMLGTNMSYTQSDNCDGDESLTLFPRPSMDEPAIGDIIFFDIEFSALDSVEFLQLPILYDPLLLRYSPENCIETVVLEGFTCANNVTPTQPGQIRILWFHPNSLSDNIFNDDPIVTIAFEVIGIGTNVTPITIPASIDGFETVIGNTDPDAPNQIGVDDFCQIFPMVTFGCTTVIPFIQPCAGNMPGSASINIQICGGEAPYEYVLVPNSGPTQMGSIASDTESVAVDNLNPGESYDLIITDNSNMQVHNETIDIPISNQISASIAFDVGGIVALGLDGVLCAEGSLSTTRLRADVDPPMGDYVYVWENSRNEVVGSSDKAENLGPGNYFVTVTDINTGCNTTADFFINEPDPIRIAIDDLSGPGCNDPTSQGSITLTVTGGRPLAGGVPGQYEIEFNQTGQSIGEIVTTRPDGTLTWPLDDVEFVGGSEWTFFADDRIAGANSARNCFSPTETIVVPLTNEFTFDIQDTIVQCGETTADIAFFVTPSPADPPPSFQPNIVVFDENRDELILANNQILRTGDVINDVPPGQYTFEYTNLSDGCVGTGGFTVVDAGAISVDSTSLIPDNPNCGTVGSVNIAIDVGTGPFDYIWQDGSTDGPVRTDLLAGIDYFVTITDMDPASCGAFMNIEPIVVSGSFTFPTDQLAGMIDCDATTGTIEFTRQAGDTEDYFLDLGDGNGPVNDTRIDNVPSGVYNVQIGLANNPGCVSDPVQINLAPSSGFDLTNLMIDSVHCNFATGSIELLGQPSANPPFLMTLTDNSGAVIGEDPFFLDVAPGRYNLSIQDTTDVNGCPTEVNDIIIYDQFMVDPTTATTANIVQPTCGGASFGTIDIAVSGGVPPYTFTWDDMVATDSPIRDLDPGITYSVDISDASGTCMETFSGLVVNPIDALTITEADLDITGVDCTGALGGIGFTPPATDPNVYIIEINGVQSMPGEPVEDLDIGTYEVLVMVAGATDCNTTIMNVDIEANSNLALDEMNVTLVPDCDSFESTLEIDPGTITEPLTIILFQGNTELGRAENGDLSIENVVFGNYVLTVSNGTCDATIPINIDLDPIDLREVIETGPACTGPGDDGSIELDVVSGDSDFSLEWDDGFTSNDLLRTDLTPGLYSVTITNGTGCNTIISDIDLSLELTDPFPDIIDQVDATCRGVANGVIEFDNPGNVNTFEWDDGGTGARREDLIGDQGYRITRTVAGNQDCSQVLVIEEIRNGPDVQIPRNEIMVTPADCAGGTGQIELPPDVIINGQAPFSNFELIGLEGELLNDTIRGDDNGLFTDIPAGIFFSISVQDAMGCVGINAVRVEEGNPIDIGEVEIISDPVCLSDANGSRSIEVTGGPTGLFDIEWSSGETEQDVSSSTASALSSGDQFVIITDNVCGADTIDFTVAEGDSVNIRMDNTQITDVTCFGDEDGILFVNVLGNTDDFTFNWEQRPGMDTNRLTDLEAGLYTLTVVDDATGCASSPFEFEVGEPEEVIATLDESASVAISCRNPEGTISLDVTGGDGNYSFEWVGFPDISTGSANQLAPGMYEINIVDGQGCDENFATELDDVENVSFTVSDFDPIRCADETTLIGVENVEGGVPPYRYSIIEGGNLIDIEDRVEVGAGTFIFNVFDADGCPALNTITQEITEPDPPLISLGQDTTIDLGEDFRIIPDIFTLVGIDSVNYASTEPISFIPIGMEGISITPDRDLNIIATLIDEDGCTATDEVAISLRRTRNVYIPNVFFPTNNPGQIIEARNTVFSVATGVGVEQVNEISIFDRWGSLMYRGTEIWDGRAPNGQDALPGVYAYLVSVLFTDGQVINFKGDVTLIR